MAAPATLPAVPAAPLPATIPASPAIAPVIDLTAERDRRRGTGRLRPSRRGRLAAAALVTTMLFGLVLLGLTSGVEAVAPPATAGHAVVRPGETLWDVATSNAGPGVDPRAYLDELVLLNGLGGGAVAAWTVVLLPAG